MLIWIMSAADRGTLKNRSVKDRVPPRFAARLLVRFSCASRIRREPVWFRSTVPDQSGINAPGVAKSRKPLEQSDSQRQGKIIQPLCSKTACVSVVTIVVKLKRTDCNVFAGD